MVLYSNIKSYNMFGDTIMIIHIRNFGKIEKADIDLSDFVVFVGENNSGKSYVMQLIYGLFSLIYDSRFLSDLADDIEDLIPELKDDKDVCFDSELTVKSDNVNFFERLQDIINDHIDHNKQRIIENTFHTSDLSIDTLRIEFSALHDSISLTYEPNEVKNREKGKSRTPSGKYSFRKNDKVKYSVSFVTSFVPHYINRVLRRELLSVLLSELTDGIGTIRNMPESGKNYIYLPASRSGIMLLYANYLSNDTNNDTLDDIKIENQEVESPENEYGLTQPIYDFLMFLLKHKNSEMIKEDNKKLLSFIDSHIIKGRMEKFGNSVRYLPEQTERSIPIYLSSSLVSELAPIYQILSGIRRFSFIMYDEIETCQHPTKQLQLARLIMRMVNSGYKMMVSTHSDTMAVAINNLITLSCKKHKEELVQKMDYENEDILQTDNVRAYQFLIGENGKTVVKEVCGHFSVGSGFDFDLFNNTNEKIYQDAVMLSEVD